MTGAPDVQHDLLAEHDALLLDLDGTLYVGSEAVPGAPEALAAVAARGLRVAYLTNNASRGSAAVAEQLTGLGFRLAPEDVLTSAQVAAGLLADRLAPRAAVLVIGSAALAAEIRTAGLTAVEKASGAAAVVQGYSPDVGWPQLAEGCLAIQAGALWVATNLDATLPTERGLLPGNGSLVAALRQATGADPVVAGKPQPLIFRAAVERTGSRRPLMVGDRLDSDIAGANATGLPSLLVLTGVSGARHVLDAPPEHRPDYIAADLGGLTAAPDELRPGPQPGWKVTRDETGLVLHAAQDADGGRDTLAALRALCVEQWAAADPSGARPSGADATGVDATGVEVRGADPDAEAALRGLGLRPRRSADSPSAPATVEAGAREVSTR